METDTALAAAALPAVGQASAEPAVAVEPRSRLVARFVVAAAVSAGLCLLVWSRVPHVLTGQIDIVGAPTFFGYDYRPPFWAYRLIVMAFPVALFLIYALVARFGPLRRPTRAKPAEPIRIVDPSPVGESTPETSFHLGMIARLGLPAGVLTLAVASRTGTVDRPAILSGLGYLILVVAVGALLPRWSSRLGLPAATELTRRPADIAEPPRESSKAAMVSRWPGIAVANGVGGAVAAIAALWFVSEHTVVTQADGTEQAFPWLSLWLVVPAAAAVLWWSWRQLRSGRPAPSLEKTLLMVIAGSAAVFLATSRLPNLVDYFWGFDDAQDVTGASLLSRGYFPWRDQLFIHGLWPDVLSGNVGTAIFGDSVWGVFTGSRVLLYPLCWVFLYLFAVWASRGNPWLPAIAGVVAASGFLVPQVRFILVPIVLIVLGETIRRRSRAWCAGLVVLLLIQAVMVPETSFLALPALACVIAADLLHREPGATPWQALHRSRWCVVAGVAAMAVFGGFLAANGSLGAFVDYYVIFGPGHNVAGALRLNMLPTEYYFRWVFGVGTVLLTFWTTAARLRRRGDWQATDWVMVAAAGFVLLYEEKALGRFDGAHIDQVLMVALPLILLWLGKAASVTDGLVFRRRPVPAIVNTATVFCLALVVFFQAPLTPIAEGAEGFHRISAQPAAYAYPGLDNAGAGVASPELMRDLETVLRTYAGDDEPVFDMSNSPGYIYYLLKRDPGTRFSHVSMAIPPYAQQRLISELKQSRPPVVIFDAINIGLASWDFISANVRHYAVSQYILDGWTPVLRTHGNLIMLRNDLVAGTTAIPSLSQPPITDDLWFSGQSCEWMKSPNFLQSAPAGKTLELPIQSLGTRTFVELNGWAADVATGHPGRLVVLVSGDRVLETMIPNTPRWDVSYRYGPASLVSGFHLSAAVPTQEVPSVLMLAEDSKLHPLVGSAPTSLKSVTLPDGRSFEVSATPSGSVEQTSTTERMVGRADIPAGTALTDFDLATLSAPGREIAEGRVVISDDIERRTRFITADSLPGMRPDLSIRVGSCLQWRGYDPAAPLYVVQEVGTQASVLTLSGVRDQ